MSERSVIVSVLVALIMVGLWKVTSVMTARTDEGPAPLLDFDPASVDRIEVRRGAEGPVVIERGEVLGSPRWMVRWARGEEPVSWPADEGAVRAGLRVLSTATIEERAHESPLDGGTLTLHLADGSTRTLRFGADPLAGRVEVEASTPSSRPSLGLADAALFDAFVRTGLLAWRDGRALAPFSAGPARLELESPSGALALVRRQGRWQMLEPLVAAASPEAARELTNSLGSLTVDRLEGGADPADPAFGFAAPLATVTTETDYRVREGGEATGGTLRQRMLVGGPVDATGESVFVLLEWTRPNNDGPPSTVAGPVVGRVRTEGLNKLTTRPEPYIAPIAVTTLAASVEHLTLGGGARGVALSRIGSAWSTRDEALLPDETERIDALLTLLTEAESAAIRIVTPEDAASGGGITVRLAPGDGTPPIDVHIAREGERAVVVIGTIAREYPESGALAGALADLFDRIAPPQPAPRD